MTSRRQRKRVVISEAPSVVYAIGDIHGCIDLLLDLEAKILADSIQFSGEKLIVVLGDFVDRGPNSAHVVDHLVAPPPDGFQRICLCGNHEELMTKFLEAPGQMRKWLKFGGYETLMSYGIRPDPVKGFDLSEKTLRLYLDAHIPKAHFQFLAGLPSSVEMEDVFFAHAGIDPSRCIADQRDEDLMWITKRFLDFEGDFEKTVVHGHTPCKSVHLTENRIAVDTGAYVSGVLSAVRIAQGLAPTILQTKRVME